MNHLQTKVDDLNVGKSKTVSADPGKKRYVVDNEFVKNTKLNTHKRKIINLEKTIPDAATLIHNNQ